MSVIAVLTVILSVILVVHSTECYDILTQKGRKFWIWVWDEESWIQNDKYLNEEVICDEYLDSLRYINGNFNPATYIGSASDKIHKFEYKGDNGETVSLSFEYKDDVNNPCKQLAEHIKHYEDKDYHDNPTIPLIQLSAKMEHPARYYQTQEYYRPREGQPFLIRPIQKIDNEILIIGKNDLTLKTTIRAAVYGNLDWFYYEKHELEKHIKHYNHQNVFTTIKLLSEDYNNNKEHDEKLIKRYQTEIRKHPGIVLFAFYGFATKIGEDLANSFWDVQLNNLWKHTKPFLDWVEKKKEEFSDAISNKQYTYNGKEYPLKDRIFDAYSYLDVATPPFANNYKWTQIGTDYGTAPLHFDGPNNNKLLIHRIQHYNPKHIQDIQERLQEAHDKHNPDAMFHKKTAKLSTKYNYVLVEYDLERFLFHLDDLEENSVDDQVETIKKALTLENTKIVLIDFPHDTNLMNYLLLNTDGADQYVQHNKHLDNIITTVRNAVMSNVINAIVQKDKLKNQNMYFAVGEDHCGVDEHCNIYMCGPMNDLQNTYSLQVMLADPSKVVSYYRHRHKEKVKVMWRLDPRPPKKQIVSYIGINMENHILYQCIHMHLLVKLNHIINN
eukprot:168603_1